MYFFNNAEGIYEKGSKNKTIEQKTLIALKRKNFFNQLYSVDTVLLYIVLSDIPNIEEIFHSFIIFIFIVSYLYKHLGTG